jgi:hypothetical protein
MRKLMFFLGIVATCALVFSVFGRSVGPDKEYSVAQLQVGLHDHPRLWLGRTILVRAYVVGCPPGYFCYFIRAGTTPLGLVDTPTASMVGSLPLVVGSDSPLLTFLRQIPFVNGFVPAWPDLHLGRLATYRVHLIEQMPCRIKSLPTSCMAPKLVSI